MLILDHIDHHLGEITGQLPTEVQQKIAEFREKGLFPASGDRTSLRSLRPHRPPGRVFAGTKGISLP
jgi:hypothetical protein